MPLPINDVHEKKLIEFKLVFNSVLCYLENALLIANHNFFPYIIWGISSSENNAAVKCTPRIPL